MTLNDAAPFLWVILPAFIIVAGAAITVSVLTIRDHHRATRTNNHINNDHRSQHDD